MNPDFVDLLRAFADADVRFLVVGAYALALHGRPRATGDLDIWIEATPENASRVVRALAAFGAPLRDVSEADFSREGIVYQIELTGVAFTEAWPERQRGRFGDIDVDFIGRAAYIKNKKATGRPRDLGDIDGL